MVYSKEDLDRLIQIGTGLIMQFEEFIITDELDIKVKEVSATNMVLLDSMIKNAINLQFEDSSSKYFQEFIQLFLETLEHNYTFAKKIVTGK